ncbi:MAG: 3-hydroxyacyl-CoA dehydrogenase NAD-binding domain-containing protein [Candidatus Thorarchaeota archaeon]
MSIKKIAVIGAGLMGSGISYVSAASGYNVIMMDINDEAVVKGMDRLRSYVESGVKRGKLSDSEADELLGCVETTTSAEDAVSDVDLVIEAVYGMSRKICSREWMRPLILVRFLHPTHHHSA